MAWLTDAEMQELKDLRNASADHRAYRADRYSELMNGTTAEQQGMGQREEGVMMLTEKQALEIARAQVPDSDPKSYRLALAYRGDTNLIFVNAPTSGDDIYDPTTILVDRASGTAVCRPFIELIPLLADMTPIE